MISLKTKKSAKCKRQSVKKFSGPSKWSLSFTDNWLVKISSSRINNKKLISKSSKDMPSRTA